MEISVARKRLEEMRADLDRTVSILLGEHHLVRGGGAEPGDAGANLTEADRNAAAVDSAKAQRAEVIAALARIDDGSYGRCVDCAGPVAAPRLEARRAPPPPPPSAPPPAQPPPPRPVAAGSPGGFGGAPAGGGGGPAPPMRGAPG